MSGVDVADPGGVHDSLARQFDPRLQRAPGVDARNETLHAMKRFGGAIWKQWSGHHKRSLAETKMHGFKRLGQLTTEYF